MVVGATVFGYVIANVSTLLSSSSFLEAKAMERIYLIKEFLKESKTHKTLSNDVLSHFVQASRMTSAFDKKELFERLPTRLRNEILIIGYRDTMSSIPLFKYIRNVSIKLFLLRIMTPQVAVTGRRIIREGKTGNDVYFLVQGSASIFKIEDTDSKGLKNNAESKASNKLGAQLKVTLRILRAQREKEKEEAENEREKNDALLGINPELAPKSGIEKMKSKVCIIKFLLLRSKLHVIFLSQSFIFLLLCLSTSSHLNRMIP